MNLKVFFIDSFTNKVFGGNPAGVIFHSDPIEETLMQAIAAENNLSETAFINTQNDNQIRFFTPELEVDLCGHATLASAFVFFKYIENYQDQITFLSNRGKLIANKTEKGIKLTLPKDNPEPFVETDSFSNMLGCKVLEVYRGIDDFMVVIDSESEVKDLKPNFSEISKLDSRGLIVTAHGVDVDFVSRWFGPQTGVDEDPVTGSAHTLLAPYWSAKLGKNKMNAKQLSNRGGFLICEVKDKTVEITGQAKLYLRGSIHL